VYELLAAGVITGILVPQIVKAAAHSDGGSRYVSKLLTLGSVVLVAATALMMALAPALIWLYTDGWNGTHALAVAFAYWLLPQLLFYGLFALLGEVLNARKVFGPYSWAPTVNNLVSIAGFGVFLLVFGGPFTELSDWDAGMIALLGGTATLGIALQTFVLLLFWKRTRLHIRPDFGGAASASDTSARSHGGRSSPWSSASSPESCKSASSRSHRARRASPSWSTRG
jgi:putative peptidoglycan lipid II flippase